MILRLLFLSVFVTASACHDEKPLGPRTIGAHAQYSTSTQNLLLDPFLTSDTSWGHFNTFLEPDLSYIVPGRAFLSASPGGIAAPVERYGLTATLTSYGTYKSFAPFPGSATPCTASIWMNAQLPDGTPIATKNTVAAAVVELAPNDHPTMTYVLEPVKSSRVTIDGQQWIKLALAAPVSMPQGGWFTIAISDTESNYFFQAPEVAPVTDSAAMTMASTSARNGSRDPARTQAALDAYKRIADRSTPRRPR